MDEVRIEELDWSDLERVGAARVLVVAAFENSNRYGEERVAREICESTGPFYRKFFVATRDGQVLGVAGIKGADWASNTHILYLLAVAKESRRQGIARALVRARLDWLLASFPSGRILVSTAKPRRFRGLGFRIATGSRKAGLWLMFLEFGGV
jgi:predicted N-acetyltransferase YhbS